MDIVVGSGKARRSITIPSAAAAKASDALKIELEKATDTVKSFLFRPGMLTGKK